MGSLGHRTETKEVAIELSLIHLLRNFTPLLLGIAHNLIASLENSGQFKPLVGKIADSLNKGSKGGYPGLATCTRAIAQRMVTPELMYGTVARLNKDFLKKKFVELFAITFEAELRKQAIIKLQLTNFKALSELIQSFLDVCVDWISQGRGKSFSQFLKDKKIENPQFLIILEMIGSTLVEIIVNEGNKKTFRVILQEMMPEKRWLDAWSIGRYADSVVKTETLRLFLDNVFTEAFKTVFTPQAPESIKPVKEIKEVSQQEEKNFSQDDETLRLQLEDAFIVATLAVKPLIIDAVKLATPEQKLEQLRASILDKVGRNQTINDLANKSFSKKESDDLIDRLATAFNQELITKLKAKIPVTKRIRFFNLLEQFLGNTLATALDVSYAGGLINNIDGREFINEMLTLLRQLKPKDWSSILSVAFPNRLKRKGAQFFLSYLLDDHILVNIFENVAVELNKILDPELGGFLQVFENFNQQIETATKKNLTPEIRQQLVTSFDKLAKGASQASIEIDRRTTQIDEKVRKLLKQKEEAKDTISFSEPINRLKTEKLRLLQIKTSVEPLCCPENVSMMKNTLRQGDHAQLEELAKKLSGIGQKLSSLIREVSPFLAKNKFSEKVRAFFMSKGAEVEYLRERIDARKAEHKQAETLYKPLIKTLKATQLKLNSRKNFLNIFPFQGTQLETEGIQLALTNLFEIAARVHKAAKNSDKGITLIDASARELRALAAPILALKR